MVKMISRLTAMSINHPSLRFAGDQELLSYGMPILGPLNLILNTTQASQVENPNARVSVDAGQPQRTVPLNAWPMRRSSYIALGNPFQSTKPLTLQVQSICLCQVR